MDYSLKRMKSFCINYVGRLWCIVVFTPVKLFNTWEQNKFEYVKCIASHFPWVLNITSKSSSLLLFNVNNNRNKHGCKSRFSLYKWNLYSAPLFCLLDVSAADRLARAFPPLSCAQADSALSSRAQRQVAEQAQPIWVGWGSRGPVINTCCPPKWEAL